MRQYLKNRQHIGNKDCKITIWNEKTEKSSIFREVRSPGCRRLFGNGVSPNAWNRGNLLTKTQELACKSDFAFDSHPVLPAENNMDRLRRQCPRIEGKQGGFGRILPDDRFNNSVKLFSFTEFCHGRVRKMAAPGPGPEFRWRSSRQLRAQNRNRLDLKTSSFLPIIKTYRSRLGIGNGGNTHASISNWRCSGTGWL